MARNQAETAQNDNRAGTDADSTPENLFEAWMSQPGAYREQCQVFRTQPGESMRQAGWVGDVNASDLMSIRAIIAKHKAGGPGQYKVNLLDVATGKQARCGWFRVDVDMRTSGPTLELPPSNNTNPVKELADALKEVLRPAAKKEESSSADIRYWMDKVDDLREKASQSYQNGWNAGFEHGLKVAGTRKGDAPGFAANWTAADVRDIVRETREIFRPSSSTGTRSKLGSPLDILRHALVRRLAPDAVLELVRLTTGDTTLINLAANWKTIVDEAMRDDVIAREAMTPEGQTWIEKLAAALKLWVERKDAAEKAPEAGPVTITVEPA